MRRPRMIIIGLAGAILVVPAHAQQGGASADEIHVVGQHDKDESKVVCKKKAATGTRFASRTCKSVKEWNTIREQHMRDAKEMIDRVHIETRRG